MPCQHHKDALIEAAASGVEPQGELRGHLAGCAECRATFEQERSLFASIDSGLRVAANAEGSVSLLPRVRARLDVESVVPSRRWAGNWLVLASAAVIVAGIFVARVAWRPVVRENPSIDSREKSSSAPAPRSPQVDAHNSERIAKNNPAPAQQTLVAQNSPKAGMTSSRHSGPEVLVPKDQEVLLAEYAEQWRQRKHAPLLAQDSDATILAPLQVAQIQIAELDVKPLAEEKSQ
jgi:hypothetical protein